MRGRGGGREVRGEVEEGKGGREMRGERREGDEGKRREGDEGKRREGDEGKRREGDEGKRREGDEGKRREGDGVGGDEGRDQMKLHTNPLTLFIYLIWKPNLRQRVTRLLLLCRSVPMFLVFLRHDDARQRNSLLLHSTVPDPPTCCSTQPRPCFCNQLASHAHVYTLANITSPTHFVPSRETKLRVGKKMSRVSIDLLHTDSYFTCMLVLAKNCRPILGCL